MSRGPEGGCPEPVYPRELRVCPRFEAVEDLGSDGEGVIVFESTNAQLLIEGLNSLPRSSRRLWLETRKDAFIRERAYEAVARGFGIPPRE